MNTDLNHVPQILKPAHLKPTPLERIICPTGSKQNALGTDGERKAARQHQTATTAADIDQISLEGLRATIEGIDLDGDQLRWDQHMTPLPTEAHIHLNPTEV